LFVFVYILFYLVFCIVQFWRFYVGGGGMAWRSPASEVNLRAIDETVVHAHESNQCPL